MPVQQKWVLKYVRTKFKLWAALSKKKAAQKAFQLFCTPQHRNTKPLTALFKEAQTLHFHFHKYTIQGYQWNAAAREKVLILHGFESSVINFERYVKPLLKKGYGVLAFDAPAHGRSSGNTINVLLYKQFIETILKQYGPVKNFIAHSLGGLALSLVLEDLPHDENYKAVLIAPATETTTSIDQFFHLLKLDGGVRKEFDKIIEKKGGHAPEWFSVRRAAPHIKATVLWLHDSEDTMTPLPDAVKVKDMELPNFQFVITEGLGHRRIYRDSGVLKTVIHFL